MKSTDLAYPGIASPFANGDVFRDYEFYKDGFTAQLLAPVSQGGKPFNRHMLNGLGYLATVGTFLSEVGYPFETAKVSEIAEKFGGYPKGAIVNTINENGWVVEYRSLVDDNTNPIPDFDEVAHIPVANEFWQPLYETIQLVGVPNYGSVIKSTMQTVVVDSMVDNTFIVLLDEIPDDAMIVASRTISNFDNLEKINLIYGAPTITCSVKNADGTSVELGSMPLSNGMTDMQVFPVPANSSVIVSSTNYNTAVYGDITVSINAYSMSAPA